jgi:branched-chain amino acid transport system ATP-binding protein
MGSRVAVTASQDVGGATARSRRSRTASHTVAAQATVPVLSGLVGVRWGLPLLPSLSDFAADRVWHTTAIASDNAAGFAVAGAALVLLGASAVAGLARAIPAAPTRVLQPHSPGPPSTTDRRHPGSILEAASLDVRYGSVQILFDVSFHVAPGEAVAMLGTNGAGKSTALRAITGLTPVASGEVWFDGARVTDVRAERLAAAGLSLVPGGKGIFRDLTVEENLRMAGYRLAAADYEAALTRVRSAFPRLIQAYRRPAGLLSGGEQQMLALCRAHMTRPKVLAIDELTLGLAPVVVRQLLEFVRMLRDSGVALVLVEQSVNLALEVCDRAYFLERGEVRFEGPTRELLARDDLLRSVFLEGARGPDGARGRHGGSMVGS